MREAREQIQSINKEQESKRNVIPDVITVRYITMILFFKLNNTVMIKGFMLPKPIANQQPFLLN